MTKTQTGILAMLLASPATVGGIGRPAATLCVHSTRSDNSRLYKAAEQLADEGLICILVHVADGAVPTRCAVARRDREVFLETGEYEAL